MPVQVNLSDRQQQILRATVRHYIATAEPVGSKALVEEYNLKVSSATIRNAMGDLEKAGFLYQPHTSAGRIPSDSGYRIYVDQLITPSEELATQVEQLLTDQLNWQNWSFEAALHGAAQILATLSGYIAMITMPQTTIACLRHLQLVQVATAKIMLVVVTDAYETQSVLMDLPTSFNDSESEIIDKELEILSNFLNSKLKGKSLPDLVILDWSELDKDFQQYADFLRHLLTSLTKRTQAPTTTRILMSGLAEVLRLPEFCQSQQIPTLVQLLEEDQDLLWPLIFGVHESSNLLDSSIVDPSYLAKDPNRKRGKRGETKVRIGAENPLEPIRTCTLISAVYRRGKIPVGSVGVLGPTRMVYENAIAVVEAAADYLSDTLS